MQIVIPAPVPDVRCEVCSGKHRNAIWEHVGEYHVLCWMCAAQVLAWLVGWRPGGSSSMSTG